MKIPPLSITLPPVNERDRISKRSHLTLIALFVPLYILLFYCAYLLLIDNKPLAKLVFQAERFSSCDAVSRDEARACEIDEVKIGEPVYLWRELCTVKGVGDGIATPSWETDTISYNVPLRKVYSRIGCYGRSFRLETPTLAITREYRYVNTWSWDVNNLVTAKLKFPPVPLRILAPEQKSVVIFAPTKPGPAGPPGKEGPPGPKGDAGKSTPTTVLVH